MEIATGYLLDSLLFDDNLTISTVFTLYYLVLNYLNLNRVNEILIVPVLSKLMIESKTPTIELRDNFVADS